MTFVLVVLIGCSSAPKEKVEKTEPAEGISAGGNPGVQMAGPVAHPRGREPFVTVPTLARGDLPTSVHVDLYQLSVPYGTVSRNEKFWKRIDENCVDPTTYDTL